MDWKTLKARMAAFAVLALVSLGLVATPAAATDISSSTDTLNALLPTIIELMVIVLVISLISGLFAGFMIGKRR